jgi:hypothetical protein
MVALKLNGNTTDCPTSYDELTAGTFQRIYKEWDLDKELHERDFFKLFSILTNSSFVSVDQSPENETAIWELTRWVIETNPEYGAYRNVMTFQRKDIEIPERIGALSIGQNIILKQLLEKSRTLEENICIATAIYLQPFVMGTKFDYKEAKKLNLLIEQMPAKDIYPIGFFLLSRVMSDGKKRTSNLRLILSSLRKILRRVLPRWLTSIGSKDLVISRS